MKILKNILLFILLLVVIVLVAALFINKNYDSERSIVINKPKEEVFNFIKYVKNQDQFGKWQLSDPGMKKEYEGTDGTVGFIYRWDSKKLDKGSQKITAIEEGRKMESELDFGFGDPAKAYIITEAIDTNSTKVTWGIKGKYPYPFNVMGLFVDMGDDFEEGLQNLKSVLERQ